MSTVVQRSVLGGDGLPLDQIQIRGIAARGFHGVLEAEREAGQDFSADITLFLDTRGAASGDDLDQTVNYALVAQDVTDILSGPPVNLIETVAEQIAAAVLEHGRVQAVEVVIHKPQAPIPVPFDDVLVVIHRDRVSPPAVPSPFVSLDEVLEAPVGSVDVVAEAEPFGSEAFSAMSDDPQADLLDETSTEPAEQPVHEASAFAAGPQTSATPAAESHGDLAAGAVAPSAADAAPSLAAFLSSIGVTTDPATPQTPAEPSASLWPGVADEPASTPAAEQHQVDGQLTEAVVETAAEPLLAPEDHQHGAGAEPDLALREDETVVGEAAAIPATALDLGREAARDDASEDDVSPQAIQAFEPQDVGEVQEPLAPGATTDVVETGELDAESGSGAPTEDAEAVAAQVSVPAPLRPALLTPVEQLSTRELAIDTAAVRRRVAASEIPPLDEAVLAEQARLSEQARRPEVFGMRPVGETGPVASTPPVVGEATELVQEEASGTPVGVEPQEVLDDEGDVGFAPAQTDVPVPGLVTDAAPVLQDVPAPLPESIAFEADKSFSDVDREVGGDARELETDRAVDPLGETADVAAAGAEQGGPEQLEDHHVVDRRSDLDDSAHVETGEPAAGHLDAHDLAGLAVPVGTIALEHGAEPSEQAFTDAEPGTVDGALDEGFAPDDDHLSEDVADDLTAVQEVVTDRMDVRPAEPVEAVLAIGANLGDAQETLRRAVTELGTLTGVGVLQVGPLARTAAVGGPEQPDFLNTVVLVETTLSARELLHVCQAIEADHGRQREVRWGPRTLDVDIVVYGSLIGSASDLDLPHPRANERAFVLAPWAHIAPDAVLPGLGGGPVTTLAATAPDREGIRWLALDWLHESEDERAARSPQPASIAPALTAVPLVPASAPIIVPGSPAQTPPAEVAEAAPASLPAASGDAAWAPPEGGYVPQFAPGAGPEPTNPAQERPAEPPISRFAPPALRQPAPPADEAPADGSGQQPPTPQP